MTERQLHELQDQWDKAHSRWSQVCDAIAAMRKVADELSAERGRLAELIAERDNAEIVIIDESNLDEVVRRAEAGELAMRVDVVDIDGETA